MIQRIQASNNKKYSKEDLFLITLIDYLANLQKNDSRFVAEESMVNKVTKYALAYLGATNQYRKQFQLCLKMFDGKNVEQFTDDFKISTIKIFDDYLDNLVDDLIGYAKENINEKKSLDLNFQGVEVANDSFHRLLQDKFTHYGTKILQNHPRPHTCRKARINYSSKTTRDRIESKLRKIGKYGSIHQAIEFIEIRIGLHGKYKYKQLVNGLDELKNDFLIFSFKNEIKSSVKQKTTEELVKEAYNKYEVVNCPQYLIDKNAYKTALRKKINSTLNRN
jgi:hypothetical protein